MDNPQVPDNAEKFVFGDTRQLCTELIDHVRLGKKTATCGALLDFGPQGDTLPLVGRQDVALNWDGTPALLIETLEVSVRRFCDIDLSFALAEGENDDLQGWQRDHQLYFDRNGGFEINMLIVFEHFKLIHDYDPKLIKAPM